jgi:hypothetical protein
VSGELDAAMLIEGKSPDVHIDRMLRRLQWVPNAMSLARFARSCWRTCYARTRATRLQPKPSIEFHRHGSNAIDISPELRTQSTVKRTPVTVPSPCPTNVTPSGAYWSTVKLPVYLLPDGLSVTV